MGAVSCLAAGVVQALLLANPTLFGGTPGGVGSCVPSVLWMLRERIRAPLAAGSIIVGLSGLGAVSLSGMVLVALLLALSTPAVNGLLRRALLLGKPVPGAAFPTVPQAPPLPALPLLVALLAEPACQMSQARLCRAWRQSFVALQGARTVAERARLVELRQSYLDEIEVRDAGALRAWLADGARAASGPDRYLPEGDRHRPDAA
jgi:hypothetical protein